MEFNVKILIANLLVCSLVVSAYSNVNFNSYRNGKNVTFSWNSIEDATKYKLYIYNDKSAWKTRNCDTSYELTQTTKTLLLESNTTGTALLSFSDVNGILSDLVQIDIPLYQMQSYNKIQEPRYTRFSDIVTDKLTKLMWQDNEGAKTTQKKWLTSVNHKICRNHKSSQVCFDTTGDTATTYCSNLRLGGYTDWRLPSSVELENIIDDSKFNPAINTDYFKNVSSSGYWSSTSYRGKKYHAWYVYFSNGYVYNYNKNYYNYVRCVRDSQ
jgi:hypothetical protein